MKLRNLSGAVRKINGPVKVAMRVPGAEPLHLDLVKSALLAGLKNAYGDDPQAETGLSIDDDGYLKPDGEMVALGDTATDQPIDETPVVPDAEDQTIDIEDLLGDPTPAVVVDDVEDLLA